jgi:hypothetical protein
MNALWYSWSYRHAPPSAFVAFGGTWIAGRFCRESGKPPPFRVIGHYHFVSGTLGGVSPLCDIAGTVRRHRGVEAPLVSPGIADGWAYAAWRDGRLGCRPGHRGDIGISYYRRVRRRARRGGDRQSPVWERPKGTRPGRLADLRRACSATDSSVRLVRAYTVPRDEATP